MNKGVSMNKDFDLKKDPHYKPENLRARIEHEIKAIRDATVELHQPQAKVMPIIPVTGSGNKHKYLKNKSPRAY
jgi:hypothetical protein